MNVLIATEPDDIHAILVKLALEKKGVNCDLLFSADMPSKQKNSIFIANDNFSWQTKDAQTAATQHYDQNYDAIWWRRPRRPYVPESLHEEDHVFIKRENSIYHNSIPFLLNPNAWWVNPISSHAKAESKIIQLKLAQQCGFKLPKTLISNSPEDIKRFIACDDQAIYKSFYPQYWLEIGGLKMVFTNTVGVDNLPSDRMLQMVPGIYQHYIEKKYELRVTCFGTHISAIKIDSQNHLMGQKDWRQIPATELVLEKFELPQSIKDKIILFMIKIGVVFGCFDFIVTPEDDIVFLEMNEQGQFLWVEEFQTDLYYLDMFSEFIINKSFNFFWYKSNKTLWASDLDEEAIAISKENMTKHVYLNQIREVA